MTRGRRRWRTAAALTLATSVLLTACGGETTSVGTDGPTTTTASPAAAGPGIEGTWEVEWTGDELVEVTGIDEPWVRHNAGRVVVELGDDGAFALEWLSGPGSGDRCEGTYVVDADRLRLRGSADATVNDCGDETLGVELLDARWELVGDTLVLDDAELSPEPDVTWWMAAFLASKPFGRHEAAAGRTLTIAATGGFGDAAVARLGEELEIASDGGLRLEVADEWDITATAPDVERQLVEAVAAGDVDLAIVGTRALDDLGVPDFRALTAPMVVDSHQLLRAVLTSELPARMLPAVASLGVDGLAVLGGALRRPGATDAPLLGPDDYDGITFSVFSSGAGEEAIEALGATATDVAPAERDTGLQDGSVHGLENALDLFASRPFVRHVTANVALWPGTAVLLANPDALDDLGAEARQVVLDAARQTAAAFVDEPAIDEAQLAGLICQQGGEVVLASDEDVAALRAAFAPVVARLAEDPATAEHLAAIERLRSEVTPEEVALPEGCVRQ